MLVNPLRSPAEISCPSSAPHCFIWNPLKFFESVWTLAFLLEGGSRTRAKTQPDRMGPKDQPSNPISCLGEKTALGFSEGGVRILPLAAMGQTSLCLLTQSGLSLEWGLILLPSEPNTSHRWEQSQSVGATIGWLLTISSKVVLSPLANLAAVVGRALLACWSPFYSLWQCLGALILHWDLTVWAAYTDLAILALFFPSCTHLCMETMSNMFCENPSSSTCLAWIALSV